MDKKDFDGFIYCKIYPDVRKNYTPSNAWKHYKKHGKQENRIFCSKIFIRNFDGVEYCKLYPDINTDYNYSIAWLHYQLTGKHEHRKCCLKKDKTSILEKHQHIIQEDSLLTFPDKEESKITILIRTCYRPMLFKQCIQSILDQSYSNVYIIICYDDKRALEYIKPYLCDNITSFYIHIDSEAAYKFNLYCNELLKRVTDGYIMFLDDDTMFTHNNALNIINQHLDTNKLLMWRYMRGDSIIFPNDKANPKLGDYDTCSFCFSHTLKELGAWWDKKCGDHHYFSAIMKSLIQQRENTNLDNIVYVDHILTRSIQLDRIGNFGQTF